MGHETTWHSAARKKDEALNETFQKTNAVFTWNQAGGGEPDIGALLDAPMVDKT